MIYGTLREGPYSKQGAYFFFEIQQYARNKALMSTQKDQEDWKMDLLLILPRQIDQPSKIIIIAAKYEDEVICLKELCTHVSIIERL